LNCDGRLVLAVVDLDRDFGGVRGGRLLVPEKMTSSMSAARIDLWEVSPMTQRSASTRFDLPQPFGPTTPVRPGSIRKSVGSTKDLKPISRRRVSFIPIQFQVAAQKGQNNPTRSRREAVSRKAQVPHPRGE
jgi:hypothetical protein